VPHPSPHVFFFSFDLWNRHLCQTIFESNELLVWGGISLDMTISATYYNNRWRPCAGTSLMMTRKRNCTLTYTHYKLRGCVKVPDQNIFYLTNTIMVWM
jgi:hypothetical protein